MKGLTVLAFVALAATAIAAITAVSISVTWIAAYYDSRRISLSSVGGGLELAIDGTSDVRTLAFVGAGVASATITDDLLTVNITGTNFTATNYTQQDNTWYGTQTFLHAVTSAAPSAASDIANKAYVDSAVSSGISSFNANANAWPATQSFTTATVSTTPAAATDVANKAYVDAATADSVDYCPGAGPCAIGEGIVSTGGCMVCANITDSNNTIIVSNSLSCSTAGTCIVNAGSGTGLTIDGLSGGGITTITKDAGGTHITSTIPAGYVPLCGSCSDTQTLQYNATGACYSCYTATTANNTVTATAPIVANTTGSTTNLRLDTSAFTASGDIFALTTPNAVQMISVPWLYSGYFTTYTQANCAFTLINGMTKSYLTTTAQRPGSGFAFTATINNTLVLEMRAQAYIDFAGAAATTGVVLDLGAIIYQGWGTSAGGNPFAILTSGNVFCGTGYGAATPGVLQQTGFVYFDNNGLEDVIISFPQVATVVSTICNIELHATIINTNGAYNLTSPYDGSTF